MSNVDESIRRQARQEVRLSGVSCSTKSSAHPCARSWDALSDQFKCIIGFDRAERTVWEVSGAWRPDRA